MNLLNDRERVIPTALTRKITLNGITKVYPVYKIRIDALYYNDQNDRIASWITQYKDENKISSLLNIEREKYNNIIENFIVESNPLSIEKTQVNIELVGQREPGVVLSDGRIIDGNRRFTCIRRLNNKDKKNCWFEAVILDVDLNDSRKIIKMLELNIQHGEEKRTDYNQFEKYIGLYRDIIDTELLSIEEYALSTNESVNEIKKKIDVSKIIVDFLEYINMPKKYHIARDYQIVSLANDLLELRKKCFEKNQKENLNKNIYLNILMATIGDSRKYVKNISTIISNNMFDEYFEKELEIEKKVFERYNNQKIETYAELKLFARINFDLAEELREVLDCSLNSSKRIELFNEPSKIVSKAISSLRTIDMNIVSKLPKSEVQIIKNQINSINNVVSNLEKTIEPENVEQNIFTHTVNISENENTSKKRITLIPSKYNDFIEIDNSSKNRISNLLLKLSIRLLYDNLDNDFILYFVDKNYEICSNVVKTKLITEFTSLSFQLFSKISDDKKCFLIVKKNSDLELEVRFLIEFDIDILFGSGFEF